MAKLSPTDVYPSPRPKDRIFGTYWEKLLPDLMRRPNFKPSHLTTLEILCGLYSDLFTLDAIIQDEGLLKEVEDFKGKVKYDAHPAFKLKDVCLKNIFKSHVLLGIRPMEDTWLTDKGDEPGEFA